MGRLQTSTMFEGEACHGELPLGLWMIDRMTWRPVGMMGACHSASGVSEMLEADTASMRSAAGQLRRAGQEAHQVANAVRDDAARAGSVIGDGAVAGAAVAAVQAIAAQLSVCAAGLEHAAGGVCGAADAFDELDQVTATRLSSLTGAMGGSRAG